MAHRDGIHIFHPGEDDKLGTEDEYLYAIVPIPLVNPMAKAGLRLRTDITRQRKIRRNKNNMLLTKAVTEEASYSFTIQIWAQECETTPPPS
ncbi:MAG: hypothetical protein QXP36_11750 [Conexivisphaerales archaeon]